MKIEQVTNNKNMDASIIASLANAEKKDPVVPAGYMKVTLSTEGRVGAPAEFHIRNFKTRDIMSLALTEEENLPARVLSLLKDLIYEKDVNVNEFHEKEIIETLLLLYHAFYSPSFDINFPFNEEDFEYIRKHNTKESAEQKISDLKTGKWKPQTNINIVTDVETYELPKNFSATALVKSKSTGFTLGFRSPKYGDALIIKKWLRDTFKEDEDKFQNVAKIISIQEEALEEVRRGNVVDITKLPKVTKEEEEEYNNFRIKRAGVIVDVIRALHLYVYDGKDVSKEPLSQRYEMIQDPRIDEKIARKLDSYFEDIKFGIKPEVTMVNPISGEVCKRAYSFRLVDILQATKVSSNDDYEFISSI